MSVFLRYPAMVLALTLLSACANQTPTPQAPVPPPTLQCQPNKLDSWEIKGKAGITTQQDRVNANLHWQQRADNFDIELSGPLGQGRTQLFGDQHQITLISGQNQLHGASAQQLMQQQLGWSVPVHHFSYWIRGLASPLAAVDAIEYDSQGSLSQVHQDGWQVEISRHQTVDNCHLPQRLKARADRVSLLIVVKQWQLQ